MQYSFYLIVIMIRTTAEVRNREYLSNCDNVVMLRLFCTNILKDVKFLVKLNDVLGFIISVNS